MNYQQTVTYLFNSTPVFEKIGAGAYKEGLSTTKALDEHLGHPHRHFKTIHVAGTNGKGSVSHTLAAILQSAGLKVGLFTSPHLVDFRERIRINGRCVSQRFVIDFVSQHRSFFEPLHPSFFELTTAMAFDYFARQHVDIAIIEVGLGGRLDCTNIITPILSVITNISFDHTQFLGDTLSKIAGEKAGIIKQGVPVVIGESTDETRPVFEQKAKEMNAPIIFAEDDPVVTDSEYLPGGGRVYHLTPSITDDPQNPCHMSTLRGELGGDYQEKNTNTVLKAINQLTSLLPGITTQAVEHAFAHVCEMTGLTGRWQQTGSHPTIVCDTGHNVGGWQYLSKQLKSQPCHRLKMVFGMVDDKDIDTVMDMLPTDADYYFTKANNKRAISEQEVLAKGLAHGLKGTAYPTVSAAVDAALAASTPEDFIFIGGSSYIVADYLEKKRHSSSPSAD